jgi:Protein of unknown function (DUF3631)
MLKENILDDVYNYIGRFIWFPNDHYRVAATAWVAHTHLIDAFGSEGFHTPRLAVLSPVKRSGKTRVLDIIELLVQSPESMIGPTPSAVYTLTGCSEVTPTLLIDEIGRMIDRKDFGDFATIVEAGFKPGKTIPRTTFNSEGKRNIERFKVYAPMLMAGIDNGRMPDTFIDRSITISMKRNIGKRLSFRPRMHAAEGAALKERLSKWAIEMKDKVKDIEPIMPAELNDREQDKWEALYILCELVTDVTDVTAVSGWLEKIRQASLEIATEDKDREDTGVGELIIKDITNIMNNDEFCVTDRMRTSEVVNSLLQIDTSPWSGFNHGRPLDGSGLARLLKPFKIRPQTIRFGKEDKDTDKGYYRSQFKDALEHMETPVTSVTDVTPVTDITPELLKSIITPGMRYEEYSEKREGLLHLVS